MFFGYVRPPSRRWRPPITSWAGVTPSAPAAAGRARAEAAWRSKRSTIWRRSVTVGLPGQDPVGAGGERALEVVRARDRIGRGHAPSCSAPQRSEPTGRVGRQAGDPLGDLGEREARPDHERRRRRAPGRGWPGRSRTTGSGGRGTSPAGPSGSRGGRRDSRKTKRARDHPVAGPARRPSGRPDSVGGDRDHHVVARPTEGVGLELRTRRTAAEHHDDDAEDRRRAPGAGGGGGPAGPRRGAGRSRRSRGRPARASRRSGSPGRPPGVEPGLEEHGGGRAVHRPARAGPSPARLGQGRVGARPSSAARRTARPRRPSTERAQRVGLVAAARRAAGPVAAVERQRQPDHDGASPRPRPRPPAIAARSAASSPERSRTSRGKASCPAESRDGDADARGCRGRAPTARPAGRAAGHARSQRRPPPRAPRRGRTGPVRPATRQLGAARRRRRRRMRPELLHERVGVGIAAGGRGDGHPLPLHAPPTTAARTPSRPGDRLGEGAQLVGAEPVAPGHHHAALGPGRERRRLLVEGGSPQALQGPLGLPLAVEQPLQGLEHAVGLGPQAGAPPPRAGAPGRACARGPPRRSPRRSAGCWRRSSPPRRG